MATVFTKIIRGELPSFKVYEDDRVIAILALDQVSLGHTLVIPKTEVNHFYDAGDEDYQAVFKAAKKISKAIHKATKAPRVTAVIAGFEVPHFHLHLIPAANVSEMSFANAKRRSSEDMSDILERIRAHLL